MSDPISRLIMRAAYGVTQLPRVAWYVGHSLAVRRLSASAQRRDGKRARPAAHKADFTILESDPYKVSPDAIADIKVSETWVAGEQKFAA